MFRISSLGFVAVASLALAACGGETKKPDASTPQGAAADALQGVPKEQAAAAAAAFGALAANDPNMSPEDRAKVQAVYANIAAGKVHPAASAYLNGLNRAVTVIGTVKDESSIQAAKAQLAPIFAEMKPAADQLNAMSKDDRDVALGSAAPQIMTVSMTMMSSLMPLAMSNPKLGDEIDKLMSEMPEIKD